MQVFEFVTYNEIVDYLIIVVKKQKNVFKIF